MPPCGYRLSLTRWACGIPPWPTWPTLNMRRTALPLDGEKLTVYFTMVGECPEGVQRGCIGVPA